MFDYRFKFINRLISWLFKDQIYIVKYYKKDEEFEFNTNELTIFGGKGYNKWAHLICPCGCNEIINLSLMKSHNPHWYLKIDNFSRPTLYPSIWKKDGCESHFWIKKGKLIWCEYD